MNVSIKDHGIPVKADETRTAAVCMRNPTAVRIVIAAKGYLLIVHPDTEESRQVFFPSGRPDYPYACLAASDGLFYSGAGGLFMAFDPFEMEFVFTAGVPGGNTGYSLAEDPNGSIWFSVQGSCELLRYDPAIRSIESFGPVDSQESYPSYLAADAYGWIYAGIGTAHKDVVGLMPKTGERRRFVPEARRTVGSGYVYPAVNGRVYGHFESSYHWAKDDPAAQWYCFEKGRAQPVSFETVGPSQYTGYGFRRVHGRLPEPWELQDVNLAERVLDIVDRTGQSAAKRIPLQYDSQGARLSVVAKGADNRFYGTSGHPLHLFSHDPATGETVDYGGNALEEGGGGNICAYAVSGTALYGAMYPGGLLHRIDTAVPFNLTPGAARNPKTVARCPEVYRPRCCLAHPDGEQVLFGGYAGYGAVGGGLGIYDIRRQTLSVTPNSLLVPGQSFVTLAAADTGKVFAGTCVNAPGGGHPLAGEGCLAQLNADCSRVVQTWIPLPGARSLTSLLAVGGSRFFLMSSAGMFAVFDASAGKTVVSEDLSPYGSALAHGIIAGPDGEYYVLMQECVLRYDPDQNVFQTLLELSDEHKITHGGAQCGRRLFFTAGRKLCSVKIPKSKRK